MKIVPSSPEAIQHAIELLEQGEVIAHATETCYGLACDATNQQAVQKLFFIKKRPITQLVSVLVSSVEQAKTFIEWNEDIEALTTKHWPGALSIIGHLQSGSSVYASPLVTDSLSLRQSSHPTAQALVKQLGRPIVSSSANISGKREPYSAKAVFEQFDDELNLPALIVDDGELPLNPPSTIADCREGIEVVRQGGIVLGS